MESSGAWLGAAPDCGGWPGLRGSGAAERRGAAAAREEIHRRSGNVSGEAPPGLDEDELTPAQVFYMENRERLVSRAQDYYLEKHRELQRQEDDIEVLYRSPEYYFQPGDFPHYIEARRVYGTATDAMMLNGETHVTHSIGSRSGKAIPAPFRDHLHSRQTQDLDYEGSEDAQFLTPVRSSHGTIDVEGGPIDGPNPWDEDEAGSHDRDRLGLTKGDGHLTVNRHFNAESCGMSVTPNLHASSSFQEVRARRMWPECQEEDLEEQHPEMDTASESDADASEYSADAAAKGTWSDSDSDDEFATRKDRTAFVTRRDRTGAWAVF
eukprot:Skav217966  [mRNA]  locus=scaffold3450:162353:171873:- [translate_table: standard]